MSSSLGSHFHFLPSHIKKLQIHLHLISNWSPFAIILNKCKLKSQPPHNANSHGHHPFKILPLFSFPHYPTPLSNTLHYPKFTLMWLTQSWPLTRGTSLMVKRCTNANEGICLLSKEVEGERGPGGGSHSGPIENFRGFHLLWEWWKPIVWEKWLEQSEGPFRPFILTHCWHKDVKMSACFCKLSNFFLAREKNWSLGCQSE